jgi:3-oxoacyl-(acyl-carrier-protein) synthase III
MRAVITGIGHHLPEQVVTSTEVEQRAENPETGFHMPAGMIEFLSGIQERRYAPEDAASSDLATAAGLRALENAGVHPMAIDVLISSSATHDVAEPSTAAITQSKIGCKNAGVMDVKNACAGFLNGLDVAAALIQTGRAQRVLVTAGEVLSSVINWKIQDMTDLQKKFAGLTLGDAGAAAVVEASSDEDSDRGIYDGTFMADGDYWELSTVLGGGTLMRQKSEGLFFECKSSELANLAVEHLPGLLLKASERMGWERDDIKMVFPHQVTRGVITELCSRMEFPEDRAKVILDRFGNTAAASVPLALSLAVEEGQVERGDKIVLICGAAGFSAGVVPIIW